MGSCRRAALFLLLAAAPLLEAPTAAASPFGTSYTAEVSNLPGTDTALLAFDGLEEAVGSSGLLVNETAVSLGELQLIEFTLRTQDGNPFLGQQDDALAVASVSVTGLHWFGDENPAAAVADSGFLYLTIDGVAQTMSDVLGLGLSFGSHPLNPGIQVLLIDNEAGTTFVFDSFGDSLAAAFGALVDGATAAQIDDLHFGVAAAPIPEPGTGRLLAIGLLGLGAPRRSRRGPWSERCVRSSSGWATARSSRSRWRSGWPSSRRVSCSSAISRASGSRASSSGGWSGRPWLGA